MPIYQYYCQQCELPGAKASWLSLSNLCNGFYTTDKDKIK